MNTENVRITFGKHKGELYTRLPVSYLKWMSNELDGEPVELAKSELERRGTSLDNEVNVSIHAIDRASIRFLNDWKSERQDDEGIASWLKRKASSFLQNGQKEPEGDCYKITNGRIVMVFTDGNDYPTLKTVMTRK